MPAPKPQPTALRKLHGNPSKRKLPPREPKPPVIADGTPAPTHLGEEAAAEWRRNVSLLRAVRLLTGADLGALAAYCSHYGDFVIASRKLKRGGLVRKDRDGTLRRNPWLMVKNKAIEQMIRIGSEFGFTPASRPRIGRGGALPIGEGDHGSAGITENGDRLDEFFRREPSRPIQ